MLACNVLLYVLFDGRDEHMAILEHVDFRFHCPHVQAKTCCFSRQGRIQGAKFQAGLLCQRCTEGGCWYDHVEIHQFIISCIILSYHISPSYHLILSISPPTLTCIEALCWCVVSAPVHAFQWPIEGQRRPGACFFIHWSSFLRVVLLSVLVPGLCPFGFQFGTLLLPLEHLFCELLDLGGRFKHSIPLLHPQQQELDPFTPVFAFFEQGVQGFPKQVAQHVLGDSEV